jgi:ribosomal protein L37E
MDGIDIVIPALVVAAASFFLILELVLYAGFKVLVGALRQETELLCTHCGYQGKPRTYTRDQSLAELLLWLLLIAPGLIYAFWGRSSRIKVCRRCGAATLVAIDSGEAIKIRE